MKKQVFFPVLLIILLQLNGYSEKKPVDKMEWWKEAKFGMFIHWGIYSVPAGVYHGNDIPGIGEWIMNNGKIPVAGKTLNHDGLHAMTEKSMDIALSKGLHPIEVLFFQQGGGDGLQLEWIPEGKERAVIDASRLRN
jgi:hypothetical protein